MDWPAVHGHSSVLIPLCILPWTQNSHLALQIHHLHLPFYTLTIFPMERGVFRSNAWFWIDDCPSKITAFHGQQRPPCYLTLQCLSLSQFFEEDYLIWARLLNLNPFEGNRTHDPQRKGVTLLLDGLSVLLPATIFQTYSLTSLSERGGWESLSKSWLQHAEYPVARDVSSVIRNEGDSRELAVIQDHLLRLQIQLLQVHLQVHKVKNKSKLKLAFALSFDVCLKTSSCCIHLTPSSIRLLA